MTALEKEAFEKGFMAALVLADAYGKVLEKYGKPDFNDIMQAHVVMAEKAWHDILANGVAMADEPEDVLRALKEVLENGK